MVKIRNLSIDTLRLLAAFFVIILHTDYGHLPKEYGL